MYKLLIIDDQIESENRKSIYEFMFNGEFEITCIDSEEDNIENALKNEYFDCIILDNTLNSGLEKESVIELSSNYNYPIILVSNVREFSVKEYNRKEVIDFISLNLYFSLREMQQKMSDDPVINKEIIGKALKDLHERIKHDIYITRKYKEEESDKLVICHISDIQFCDPHAEENAIRTLFSKLEEFIIHRDSVIDVVVISGDIVFSGKAKEYEEALTAIKKFRDKLKRQRKEVDLLFVPGNHDYNYQSYWTGELGKTNIDIVKFKENFEEDQEEKESDDEVLWKTEDILKLVCDKSITPEMFIDFKPNSMFLNNFREFSYEITNNFQYLNKNFCVMNRKYQKRGFSLIGIDNAGAFHKNMNEEKRYIYELDSDITYAMGDCLYSIIVGHVDPRSLGYKTICESQEDRCNETTFHSECSKKHRCEKWGDMQRLFKRTNGIIYLFGHKHCSDIEISDNKHCLFIGAASPVGISASEKTVNIIEIEKKEQEICVEIAVHRATSENIAFSKTNKYQYDIKNQEWRTMK